MSNDVRTAINALNATRGNELENNYVTAAIDALNTLLTSDISPRMASKIARFRSVLKDYANGKGKGKGAQTAIQFESEGAKDANGNDVNDIYTV